jgi:hypothetical protein
MLPLVFKQIGELPGVATLCCHELVGTLQDHLAGEHERVVSCRLWVPEAVVGGRERLCKCERAISCHLWLPDAVVRGWERRETCSFLTSFVNEMAHRQSVTLTYVCQCLVLDPKDQ